MCDLSDPLSASAIFNAAFTYRILAINYIRARTEKEEKTEVRAVRLGSQAARKRETTRKRCGSGVLCNQGRKKRWNHTTQT